MKKLLPLILILMLGFAEIAFASGFHEEDEIENPIFQQMSSLSINQLNANSEQKISVNLNDEFWEEMPSLLELEEIVEIKDEHYKSWKSAKDHLENISYIENL